MVIMFTLFEFARKVVFDCYDFYKWFFGDTRFVARTASLSKPGGILSARETSQRLVTEKLGPWLKFYVCMSCACWCKRDMTPLHLHLDDVSFASTHRYFNTGMLIPWCGYNFKSVLRINFMDWILVKLLLGAFHRALLMRSQHWFR